ncbi:MAG: 2-oxo acid dehydrogenase subunit E2 [Bacteroidales bacterium]|nr:2-oxo acid dehydrogenase subunit E2 [Bacteroidales bacterium]MCF8386732.1 2-oxo acid dehydrogenase subunit E2 [Bacteroidales bacterium]MCF8397254.1 2-oxo acid dehydrogenase subunit E2 [Bacteroidales bacterium]
MQKPRVIGKQIQIRDIMNMTVLMDHDVVDGADMARYIYELVKNVENGTGLT